ncbi:MAG: hypothetical protein ACYC27_16240 [Armatimonadota bacterium]
MDNFDYSALVDVLMTPDVDMPREMIDALYYVHEMATTEGMDNLLNEAEMAGIKLDDDPDPTPIDVAIQVWFADKDIVETKHAEQFCVKLRMFEYYQAKVVKDLRYLSPEIMQSLEQDLDNWFLSKCRGRGTRVLHYFQGDTVYFLVRHGEPCKRESVIVSGESSSVFYRPEKFDVLVYKIPTGELRINVRTKGEKMLYLEMFGEHLFGDKFIFSPKKKFNYDPLKVDGEDALVCSDIPGIEWIKLIELEFTQGGQYGIAGTWKGDDIFVKLRKFSRRNSASCRIDKVIFQVKFADSKRPRMVSIKSSNIAQFQRDGDGDLFELWLLARGFVLSEEGENNGGYKELLVGM